LLTVMRYVFALVSKPQRGPEEDQRKRPDLFFKTGEFRRKFPRCCKRGILVSFHPLSTAVCAEAGIELLQNQQHTTLRNSLSPGAILNEQRSARS